VANRSIYLYENIKALEPDPARPIGYADWVISQLPSVNATTAQLSVYYRTVGPTFHLSAAGALAEGAYYYMSHAANGSVRIGTPALENGPGICQGDVFFNTTLGGYCWCAWPVKAKMDIYKNTYFP